MCGMQRMSFPGCVYHHNVVVHVYSRCSSHPLQCDGSSGEGEEVVERGGNVGTGWLAPHTSVKGG